MKVFRSISEVDIKNTIASIGFFDGVHVGHTQIVRRIVAKAKAENCSSLVITFWPHPRFVLGNDNNDLKLLSSLPEKIEIIEKEGVDAMLILEFNSNLIAQTAKEFIDKILVKTLNVKHIIVGYNHNFGRNGEGNFSLLAEMEVEGNYSAEQVDPIAVEGIKVSSSKIRSALERGNIKMANLLLGRFYSIKGTIHGGEQIGRSIGYPTANITLSELRKQIPGYGVYAVWVDCRGKSYPAMLNIGVKPTMGYNLNRTIEAHIIGFNQNIYNEEITVKFVEKIREEMRFPSLEMLKCQLEIDRNQALSLLNGLK